MARLPSLALIALTTTAPASEWIVDTPRPGVLVVRNETGAWGHPKLRMAHVNTPLYQVRKTFDLGVLPKEALTRAKAARLRLYFAIQDYSWNMPGREHNGLNETFEIVVNGQVHAFETSDPRFSSRGRKSEALRWAWTDVPIPAGQLRPGANEVILRKREGTRDDYLYPGIDHRVSGGHSATSYDGGKTWSADKLNANSATGEFMIRLVLAQADLGATATWHPGQAAVDPHGFIAYAGRDRDAWVLEPSADECDPGQGLSAAVEFTGPPPRVRWLGHDGRALRAEVDVARGRVSAKLGPLTHAPSSLTISPRPKTVVTRVAVAYSRATTAPPTIDMRPHVAPPAGRRHAGEPTCRLAEPQIVLTNRALRAVFQTQPRLTLRSLHAAEVDRNVLKDAARTQLFRIKVGDGVYGASDCPVRDVTRAGLGFTALLDVANTGLVARFGASVDSGELRLRLELTNVGAGPIDFHLAFPHLAGLQLSDESAGDHYLFPAYGGVIADTDTWLRAPYGENISWWQMIDLFSPARGGGIYVRCDDATGMYKTAALRKGDSPRSEHVSLLGGPPIRDELLWDDSLEPTPGLGVAFDYVRRTRKPGASFAAPDVCIGTHAGDWRAAMRRYADWSHRTWPPRPRPHRYSSRWVIGPVGWGQAPLFKDGAFRMDFFERAMDTAELMSWWKLGERGPWHLPLRDPATQWPEALYDFRKGFVIKEPVTGRFVYGANRGDYIAGMPEWGGLPALRRYIKRIRDKGVMPTLYITGVIVDAQTRVAQQHAKTQAVMDPDARTPEQFGPVPEGYVGRWASYSMCSDTTFWPDYLAKTVVRVCQETGADGLRIDEYGFRGLVCHNPHHEHIFAEPGHNAWMQATARACRLVRKAMDEAQHDLALMTEYPGNDHLAATLEAAIGHDASAGKRAMAVRPVPCNLFRFYFPNCKLFEINRPAGRAAAAWTLWNATASFAGFRWQPPEHFALLTENTDAFESDDTEPLVPTLVPRVYANRFSCRGKTIWTLHNGTGHTVDAPLLSVAPDAKHHVIELLSGHALTPERTPDAWAVALRIRRDETLAVARLPKRLVLVDGKPAIRGDARGLHIAAAEQNGKLVAPTSKRARERAIMVKLLRGKLLVDAMPWPR